eukprot:11188319-Lingulodinium_polyedra.AAC.1
MIEVPLTAKNPRATKDPAATVAAKLGLTTEAVLRLPAVHPVGVPLAAKDPRAATDPVANVAAELRPAATVGLGLAVSTSAKNPHPEAA